MLMSTYSVEDSSFNTEIGMKTLSDIIHNIINCYIYL